MANKVRGSIIDLPAVGSAPPSSGNYTAGQIVYNDQVSGPTGWAPL